jgi:hypothetical protein
MMGDKLERHIENFNQYMEFTLLLGVEVTHLIDRTDLFNPLNKNGRLLYLKVQFVPRSKHLISVIKTDQFTT